jgi:hypothetical protein
MTEPVKIDRKHVHLLVGDMAIGESGSIGIEHIYIDADMNVWLASDAPLDTQFDAGVVRQEDGWHLVIETGQRLARNDDLGFQSITPVVAVHVAEPKPRVAA